MGIFRQTMFESKLEDSIRLALMVGLSILCISDTIRHYVSNHTKWNKAPIIQYVWKQGDSLEDFAKSEELKHPELWILRYVRKVEGLNPNAVTKSTVPFTHQGYFEQWGDFEYQIQAETVVYLPDINRDGIVGPNN